MQLWKGSENLKAPVALSHLFILFILFEVMADDMPMFYFQGIYHIIANLAKKKRSPSKRERARLFIHIIIFCLQLLLFDIQCKHYQGM